MLLLYSHFSKKSLQFPIFLPLGVSMWGFENFRILFVWSSIHSTGIFFFAGKKCDDLVVFFNKGREKNFFVIFIKWQKLCLHKIFNIVSTTKTNFPEFWIFPEFPWTFPLLVSFFLKKFSPQIAIVLTWTANLTCSPICWSFS